mgnify:CR=1 FL=1|tara:strand:+ start:214 stop:831 length:618 start_codon:yes stop_codon:yes gene_type:complete
MADRTIKPDSGNDLVLQNNGGGTKIEIPNSGDISITGNIGSGTFSGNIGSSGSVIKIGQTKFTGDAYQANSTSYSSFVNAPSFTPDGGPNNTSTIYAFANLYIEAAYISGANNLKGLKFQIIGDDITNVTTIGTLIGTVDYGGSGSQIRYWSTTSLQGVTLDGTGNAPITVGVAVNNAVADNNSTITVYGDNTFDESYITFIEVV